jgi:hypothetical protein
VRVVTVFGVAAVLVGLASVAIGGPVVGLDLDYTFVTMVGLLALAQGVRYASARWTAEPVAAETDDPELRYRVPVPGDDVDELLARASGWSFRGARDRQTLRERLGDVAVQTLVSRGACDAAEATRRVESGEWTDDPVAAGFLSDAPRRLPLRERLRGLFRSEPRVAYEVSRTVDAIAALQEEP